MKIFAAIILFIAVSACKQNQQTVTKKEETKVDSVKAFVLKMDSAQKIISLPGELQPNENVHPFSYYSLKLTYNFYFDKDKKIKKLYEKLSKLP